MLRLHYYPGNASLAPHILLEETGADYELMLVDRANNAHKSAEYLRLNPNGRIPTLVSGDLVIWESAAICLYILERFPGSGLSPEPGSEARGRFLNWMVYLTNTLQPEILVYNYTERHVSDDGAIPTVRGRAAERIANTWSIIENELSSRGPYLMGEEFSAADIYMMMLCRWCRSLENPPGNLPAVARVVETGEARPAVQRALAQEGFEVPFFIPAQAA
ncbi:MAG: glutathione S-transferase family protein [Rhodovibrionaceae bacterium]|nr:glutathione S-transferase family protein [Rhodovibrionaceae bacterium]